MSIRAPKKRGLFARIRLPRPGRHRLRQGEKTGAEALLAGPIKGELLGAERLADRARELARHQQLSRQPSKGREPRLLARLKGTRQILDEAQALLSSRAARDVDVGPAGDWFLDNFHVVQEHIQEVLETLPKGYYRELPELAVGPLAGYPRIYELAITLISHTEGHIAPESVDLFVEAFQEVSPLGIGELWAVPAMLRLGLLENVRRMTLRTVERLEETEAADAWAARIQAASDDASGTLDATLEELVDAPPELTATFVARFLQQLRLAEGAFSRLQSLEQWIADEAMTSEEATARSMQRLALTQLKMANSITSLRIVAGNDWQRFVERQSVMEAALREDPMGIYGAMTFETRDAYRHVVERLARGTGRREEDVARAAIDLAKAPDDPSDERQRHVGHYLVGAGLPTLKRLLAYRPTFKEATYGWVRRHPNVVFVGGTLAGTVVALALLLLLGGLFGGGHAPLALALVLLFGVIPANDIAINVMNQLVTNFLPPKVLPKLDLREAIPAELRTAVVVPTLLGDLDSVQRELENLEVQFLANRRSHLHFAILSDVLDAPTEHREEDAAIVEAAAEGIRALNAKYRGDAQYRDGGEDIFYLFHRPRRYNAQEGAWMGWERKRGKLAEFNRFIRGEAAGSFSVIVGDVDLIRRVRYVITLDADTVLPPGAAALMVGAIAHPLNRAHYDPDRGRVVRGYGILQPRVNVLVPSGSRSRFASISSGQPGVDPYTTAVSDVYQDLYGEGSFTGKGIYDVEAFEQATFGRFPENTLLSHDLIEGNYARAGLVTDVVLYDDYPTRYLTYTRRKHRWTRGDWQLLRWLTRRVHGPEGLEPNRLSLLSRWKIFDNLRRSVVEIAQLAFLVAGWTILPGSPLRWTILGLLAVAAPWVVSLLLSALRPPLDKSLGPYYATVLHDAVTSARQVALAVIFLPHQAVTAADAIARTLYRLAVSRRHLLEWQTASLVEKTTSASAGHTWRSMRSALLLAGGVAIVAAGLESLRLLPPPPDPDALRRAWQLAIGMLPLVVVWLASPAIALFLDRPAYRRRRSLGPAERETVRRYAASHWSYFDRFANEASHHLAPDNFQEDPVPVVAMRTSPTNIGLQLLSTVSAYDLDLIDEEEMTRRLELAFGSLDRMQRFRGHLYNWYDLHDLGVLEPRYVSTVDSGNLAGHLLALAQACAEIAASLEESGGEGGALSERLRALSRRSERFVAEMDFRFLFDEERKLFSIGYHEPSRALDRSYYDLLASEARLASFVAVAKGDVPMEHWFRLGRTLTQAAGETALVSWSGSMFEYLMPLLVMRAFPFTLLDQTYEGAVRRHVAYGDARGVPWGISESAYNRRDRELTYQYRAFGVPNLALKRGLERDLVVAPYASALALLVEPDASVANLARLEELGALGPYGFRDAIDYTRPAPGARLAIANLYMAHHVGMSLVAFANALRGRIWQRRFHADPMVRSAGVLLHERIPRRLVLGEPQRAPTPGNGVAREQEKIIVREITEVDTPQPHVALLGHAPYAVMISHAGSGYSRYGELDVTRFRSDGTRDATGQFLYVRDVGRGRVWSAAHQPVCARPDSYRATLANYRVMFERRDGDIETRTEITVVPNDAAEVRRVHVTNHGAEEREIELTSYGEIVLAPHVADRAHPAFGNLFVETEFHAWCSALTARRRPRSHDDEALWCAHVVDAGADREGEVSWETDRARFLGRGRGVQDPIALETDGPLDGTTGAVLDPIFALRTRVRLAPGQTASVAFTTLVAESKERVLELADRYHDPHAAQRALDLAWTSKQVELNEFGLSPSDTAVFHMLAGYLLYPTLALRAPSEVLAENEGSQPLLWASGISGDHPILLAPIESPDGLPTLRQLFAAHSFCRRHGMRFDLVVLVERPSSYLEELHEQISAALFAAGDPSVVDQPGGVFIRRMDRMGNDELLMLRATARVQIPCDGRALGRILAKVEDVKTSAVAAESPPGALHARDPRWALDASASAPPPPLAPESGLELTATEEPLDPDDERDAASAPLLFDNGLGGLDADGDYRIRVRGDRLPPAPWVNVIANAAGGFIVSERGSGFTWANSSYFYRLSPWANDPVGDPAHEAIYLRDADTGELWSATPAPVDSALPFEIRHGRGVSTFSHARAGIETKLHMGIAPDRAVKISVLRITNRGEQRRRLTITSYVEWTLGVAREDTQHQVRVAYDRELETVFARNSFDPRYARYVAFSSLSAKVGSFTCDRRAFLGRNGAASSPAALRRGRPLSRAEGAGLDPCAALQTSLELAPGETREVVIILGAAEDEEAARRAAARYRDAKTAKASMRATVEQWKARLSTITVSTPEPAFDAMLNRWTLYQALACRMWARSALYQSSGAYGFRDQLQDAMAFVYAEPGVAREHILRAAGRQFVDGDVQHWWHPETGSGVRTRFSDDLLWLPFVVDHYVRVTGDASILEERAPFLEMRQLQPEEEDLYDTPQVSEESASVYEHCVRALRRGSTRGAHGLPLIGGGDWNDGMNRVGLGGAGESVWLAWFLVTNLRAFAERAADRGDEALSAELRSKADAYVAAVEAEGWDGAWYRRAFFDDGTPLGSAASEECRIDSIAQSWSVISGAGLADRQAQAMASLEEHLVRESDRLLLLLAPPFDQSEHDPGYIKGYLPGVRENGAQYTHAATWAVLATALRGDGERALELYQLINPLTRTASPEGVATYKVEPYVIAADVYAAKGQIGRGGWTWYTGAASWMYRVGLEAILGFSKRGDRLQIAPTVPASWPELSITYRFGASVYAITVHQPSRLRADGAVVELDGRALDGEDIPLVDDGARHLVVIRPRAGRA